MVRLLSLLLLLSLASSCRSFKWFEERYKKRTDSTRVEIPYTVHVQRDTTYFSTRLPGPDTVIVEKRGRSSLVIERIRDTVRVKCNCDSLSVSGKASANVGNQPVFESPLQWYHWGIFAGLGALCLFLLVLLIKSNYNLTFSRKP